MLTVEYSPRGCEGHNCSQRVMVLNGEQHFQAIRPSVSRWRGKVPGTSSTHVTGGRTSGVVGMQ